MVYLGKTAPGKPWSQKSQALAEGLLLYEENVNEYGIPIREATDSEMDGWYEVDDTMIDYSVAAIEEYKKSNRNIEPGTLLRVVNTRVDDEDRPEAARRPTGKGDESLGDVSPGLPKEKPL